MKPETLTPLIAAVDDLIARGQAIRAELLTLQAGDPKLIILTSGHTVPRVVSAAVEIVSREVEIPVRTIMSHSRYASVCRARFTAYWLVKAASQQSLSEIARNFDGRDHGTITNGISWVENKRLRDPAYRAATDKLAAELQIKLAA